MFTVVLSRAARRACTKSPRSLAPASSRFVHWFATSPRSELDRNSPESENPFQEHDVAEITENRDRRTGYERDAGGPARRAHRSRGRPSKHIRQSRLPPEVSLSNKYDTSGTDPGVSNKYRVSKDPSQQAVAALTEAGVDIS